MDLLANPHEQLEPTLAPPCISVFIFAEENTTGIAHHLDEIQVTKIDLTPRENHNQMQNISTEFSSSMTTYNFFVIVLQNKFTNTITNTV